MSIVTIQHRGGLMKNFDPQKMLPKEWAVSTDPETENQIVWMCFRPGVVKRMGTYEDFKQMVAEATDDIREQYEETFNEIKEYMEGLESSTESSKTIAETKAEEAAESAEAASQSADIATEKAEEITEYAGLSKSYAVGTNGEVREGDDSDCAGFYYDQCRGLVQGLGGTIIPMGEITYQELKNVNPLPGYAYTISNEFFSNYIGLSMGDGYLYPAGTNVYYGLDEKWHHVTGVGGVTGIKFPENTKTYRGEFTIDSDMIGALGSSNATVNHNCIYRGRDLTDIYSIEEICEMIADGSFRDLYIGDYFDITISTPYGGEETVTCTIAGLDIFLLTGLATDYPLLSHHAALMPAKCFKTKHKMNDSNTAAGGVVGSKLWNDIWANYEESLSDVFGDHLIMRAAAMPYTVDSDMDSRAGLGLKGSTTQIEYWVAGLHLPSEIQIFGCDSYASSSFEVKEDDIQLPIFSFAPYFKVGLNDSGVCNYWLRNVASNERFASVHFAGFPDATLASKDSGIRPIFCIG